MRSKVPYFVGDPVPLKFKVKVKSGEAVLSSAKVSIYRDGSEIIHDAPCEINQDVDEPTVVFIVSSGATVFPGEYRADFTVYFSPRTIVEQGITRSHVMRFHVAQRSAVLTKFVDERMMPVDETTDEAVVASWMAKGIRQLRRAGTELIKAGQIMRDLAENKTGRRK